MLSRLQRHRRLQEELLVPRSTSSPSNQSFVGQLLADAERSSKYASEFAQSLGVFCIIAFPLSFLIEQYLAPDAHNSLTIRVTAALGCVGLIFFTQLRTYSSKLAGVYWVLLVGFAGVYTFSTMLILNAAYSPPDSQHTSIWVFQYLAALFVVIQALSSWRLIVTVWFVATSAAMLNLAWVSEPNWNAIKIYVLFPAPIFLTSLIFGTLLVRYTKIVQNEKLDTAAAIGSTVAHEIRTPLAAIRGFTSGISNTLPELLRVYEEAERLEITDTKLSREKRRLIRDALTNIREEVDYSNTIIDMLLVSTTGLDFTQNDGNPCEATDCVSSCVSRFPYANDVQKEMVTVKYVKGFQINAPKLIVVHVLFNLLKNAIRHSQRSTERSVVIKVGNAEGLRIISVRDSGPGVARAAQQKIFERFYTTQAVGEGAGIGLSFCSSAMKKIGGSIECESDSTSYSLFTLTFPSCGQAEHESGS